MKFVLVYALMFSLFLCQSSAEQEMNKDMRHNGNAWFRFGPALIDCAQSARCDWWDGKDIRRVIVTDRDDLLQIKAFVRTNFHRKFDYSPLVPEQIGNYMCVNAIALYNSIQPSSPSKSDRDSFIPLVTSNNFILPIQRDNVIIHIPIAQTIEYLDLVKGIASQVKEKTLKSQAKISEFPFSSSPLSGLDGMNKGLQSNGTRWFWFGLGLIDCAQSARCAWHDGKETRVMIVTDKKDLARIKAFAEKNFQWRLGQSPIVPEYHDVVYANAISFYNIPQSLSQDDQSLSEDNLIIHIPLSSQTTVERDEIVTEYHNLMREIENPKEKDSPNEGESQPKKKQWFLLW